MANPNGAVLNRLGVGILISTRCKQVEMTEPCKAFAVAGVQTRIISLN